MAKKKYDQTPVAINNLYIEKVKTDSKYSLDIDPDNQYNFDEDDKQFIRLMLTYNNLAYVKSLMKLNDEETSAIYFKEGVQLEIYRINDAIFHRQTSTKILNLDEIGGYLSSKMKDPNVPLKQKIEVSKILIDINDRQQKMANDPTVIDSVPENIEAELKGLSAAAIRRMLNEKKQKPDNKNDDNEFEDLSVSDTLNILKEGV